MVLIYRITKEKNSTMMKKKVFEKLENFLLTDPRNFLFTKLPVSTSSGKILTDKLGQSMRGSKGKIIFLATTTGIQPEPRAAAKK